MSKFEKMGYKNHTRGLVRAKNAWFQTMPSLQKYTEFHINPSLDYKL